MQPWHIAIIVVVGLLLFGAKRLPDAARGLGRSMRILKAEVGAMSEDKKADTPAPAATDTRQIIAPSPAVAGSPVMNQPSAVTPNPGTPTPVPPVGGTKITINGRPADQG
jgi:sec-independent protein translocase protein TatA